MRRYVFDLGEEYVVLIQQAPAGTNLPPTPWV
jgi:hypothetical protein